MSDAALRRRLIRLAHENPNFRSEILPLLAEESVPPQEEATAPAPKQAAFDLKAGIKMLSPEDRALSVGLLRLANKMPQHREKLTAMVRKNIEANWNPQQIAEKKSGPLHKQPDEGYMNGEFTQQEFSELRGKQESGQIHQVDRFASEDELRRRLIRLAHSDAGLRPKLLPILAGCEKLPPALRENCEKKQDSGKKDSGKKDEKKDE